MSAHIFTGYQLKGNSAHILFAVIVTMLWYASYLQFMSQFLMHPWGPQISASDE